MQATVLDNILEYNMRNIFTLILTVAWLSGCATSQLGNYQAINTASPDCANKEAQLEWAKSQIPTGSDRLFNALGTSIWTEMYSKGKGEEHSQQQLVNDGYYSSSARSLIAAIERDCYQNYQNPGVHQLQTGNAR